MKQLLLLVFVFCIYFNSKAQANGESINGFTFVITEKIDTVSYFKVTPPVDRMGWERFSDTVYKSLIDNGFRVIPDIYTSTHTYIIDADCQSVNIKGKKRFFDLKGKILSFDRGKTIGTFEYIGKFTPIEITSAIIKKLKELKTVTINEPLTIAPVEEKGTRVVEVMTKEKQLQKLSILYQRGIITQEEFEAETKR